MTAKIFPLNQLVEEHMDYLEVYGLRSNYLGSLTETDYKQIRRTSIIPTIKDNSRWHNTIRVILSELKLYDEMGVKGKAYTAITTITKLNVDGKLDYVKGHRMYLNGVVYDIHEKFTQHIFGKKLSVKLPNGDVLRKAPINKKVERLIISYRDVLDMYTTPLDRGSIDGNPFITHTVTTVAEAVEIYKIYNEQVIPSPQAIHERLEQSKTKPSEVGREEPKELFESQQRVKPSTVKLPSVKNDYAIGNPVGSSGEALLPYSEPTEKSGEALLHYTEPEVPNALLSSGEALLHQSPLAFLQYLENLKYLQLLEPIKLGIEQLVQKDSLASDTGNLIDSLKAVENAFSTTSNGLQEKLLQLVEAVEKGLTTQSQPQSQSNMPVVVEKKYLIPLRQAVIESFRVYKQDVVNFKYDTQRYRKILADSNEVGNEMGILLDGVIAIEKDFAMTEQWVKDTVNKYSQVADKK